MITLTGGPGEGAYAVKRAPLYLRAVVAADGATDVLDQLTDTPRRGERVSVYRRTTEAGTVHLNMSGRSRRATGFYALATYEHMPEVDGEALRDNEAWRAWCEQQP